MEKAMNLKELSYCANFIRSQLTTGIPLATATSRLIKRQPEYAQFWASASQRMRSGVMLSSLLSEVWPSEGVAVVMAGESSGKLPAVLDQYCASIELRRRLVDSAKKMYYPAAIVLGSLVISLGVFVTVVPTVASAMQRASGHAGAPTGFAGAGLATQQWLLANWIACLVGLIVLGYGAYAWLRSPEVRAELARMLVSAPLYRSAIADLSFGLWTRYVAMSCSAGMATTDALKQTAGVLPTPFRVGVDALVRDLAVHHKTLGDSVDPERLPLNDPRLSWPGFVSDAFIQGEETGRLEEQLLRASDELIRSGERSFDQAISWSQHAATVFAGALVLGTMLLTYMPMLTGLKNLR